MGGINLIKKRAPLLGGNFATWMGLFGAFQCVLVYITMQDTHFNQVIAGALTGGLINIRGGYRFMMRGALSGGIFIGIFNLFEIFLVKSQLRFELKARQAQVKASYVDQIKEIKRFRPGDFRRFGHMHQRRVRAFQRERSRGTEKPFQRALFYVLIQVNVCSHSFFNKLL